MDLPANFNDDNKDPGALVALSSKSCYTQMTFCLLSQESRNLHHEALRHGAGLSLPNSNHSMPQSVVRHEIFGEQNTDFLPAQRIGGPLPALPEINFNLDGTNYADLMNSDENMLTINWADWDEFIRDAEGGPDPML
jgi:hypothetical protein